MSENEEKSFAEIEGESQNLVSEFWLFLKDNKKFWLLPIIVMLLLLGLLIILSGSSAAPFIYTLF